ncbi:hypothetical protein SLS60_008871 [Paraconiothyrium brasiliense]|uniref:Uncharacterized protein n=1 Tax=Paraconiothyrium brasiliense TaxID=300254 RepID=A0ABR3QYQ2_9PLEO
MSSWGTAGSTRYWTTSVTSDAPHSGTYSFAAVRTLGSVGLSFGLTQSVTFAVDTLVEASVYARVSGTPNYYDYVSLNWYLDNSGFGNAMTSVQFPQGWVQHSSGQLTIPAGTHTLYLQIMSRSGPAGLQFSIDDFYLRVISPVDTDTCSSVPSTSSEVSVTPTETIPSSTEAATTSEAVSTSSDAASASSTEAEQVISTDISSSADASTVSSTEAVTISESATTSSTEVPVSPTVVVSSSEAASSDSALSTTESPSPTSSTPVTTCTTILTTTTATNVPGVNVVANGNFDVGWASTTVDAPWTALNRQSWYYKDTTTSYAHSSPNFLVIQVTRAVPSGGAYQDLTDLNTDGLYTLSFYVRPYYIYPGAPTTDSCTMTVKLDDAILKTQSYGRGSSSTSYTQYTVTDIQPKASTGRLSLEYFCPTSMLASTNLSDFFYDDIDMHLQQSVETVSSSEVCNDGTTTSISSTPEVTVTPY